MTSWCLQLSRAKHAGEAGWGGIRLLKLDKNRSRRVSMRTGDTKRRRLWFCLNFNEEFSAYCDILEVLVIGNRKQMELEEDGKLWTCVQGIWW